MRTGRSWALALCTGILTTGTACLPAQDADPPLVERSEVLPPTLDGAAVKSVLAKGGWIVDLRDQRAYAKAHVEGAINVALRGRLDTWTGIVVPFQAQLLLVGDDAEIREGTFRLRRIGYDHVDGRLPADATAWQREGLVVRTSKVIAPRELHAAMLAKQEPLIVDVRTADEYADLRIGDVGNIPVTESERFAKGLDKTAPVVMVCNSAYRSSMAVGLAERLGFRDVASLDGGLDAWVAAGLPTMGRMPTTAAARGTTHAPSTITLPEPIDAPMLAKVLLEQPTTYVVLDLRPAWQFSEWTIQGAANVTTETILEHVGKLPPDRRIVLVDRDGTHAFAVAGAVMSRLPERTLRVLVGGLQQYHRHVTFGGSVTPANAMAPAAAPGPTPPTTTAAPKKRSAGC